MAKWLRYTAIALAAVLILGVVFFTRLLGSMRDFEVYWETGTRALAAQPLYRVEDQHYQFKYLPAFAVLMAPLAGVPLAIAKAIWFGLSVALLGLLIGLSVRLLPDRRRPTWLLVAVTVVAMAKFYGHELVLGQSNILLGALVMLAAWQMRVGRELLAGVLLVLAVVIKPYAIIFLPYLILRRRFTAVAAFCAGLAGALALPAISYGVEGNIELLKAWFGTVTSTTVPNLVIQDNVSIASMFSKWVGVGGLAAALTGLTLAIVAGICLLVLLRRGPLAYPEYLEMGLLLTVIPLISPQGWDYVLLVSTPAVVCLVNYFDRLPTPYRVLVAAALVLVGLSLYDVLGREWYAAFMSWSIVTMCYLALIGALYNLRVRQIA